MTARILDGEALAAQWRAALRLEIAARARPPCLAIVQVGEDPASSAYIKRKHADCAEVGVASRIVQVAADIGQHALEQQIARFSADDDIDGLIVQLPLPSRLDAAAVQALIAPHKDVDGLSPAQQAALLAGRPGLRPCTPSAVIGLLQAHKIALAGRRVAIIGRGPLVGRPLALMLAMPAVNALALVLHRGAPDLAAHTRDADVVISAAGQPDLVTAAMIKDGATVVGVGISYVDGQMRSDIAADVATTAAFVTPPHGGIGALTRAQLLRNTLAAAARNRPD
jgi:methylenetetrahydrofolate dehydrogenase (NADP+) / methenyltetrahydrofolate cyclohydrolase